MNMSKVVPIGLKTRADDRVRAALNGMPVAVSWNRIDDGRVEFMNRQFCRMFGYSIEDVSNVYDLIGRLFASPEQADHAIYNLQQLISGGTVDEVTIPSADIEIIRKDGTRLFTSFSGVFLPEANMCLATFTDITEAKALRDQLAHLANHDELTGLVNRRLFDLELAQTVSQSFPGQPFGVIVMDIDAFKAINDNHGHVVGDMVLKHFAKLMRGTFRSGDCASRWGGDEFAVIVRHPTSRSDVDTAARRLRQSVLEHPVNVGPAEIPISVSVGIAYYPEDADSITDLYNIADARMYEEKRRKIAAPAL